MYLYDLARARDIVRPTLALDGSPSGRPVTALAFSARRPDMFATGDGQSIQVRAGCGWFYCARDLCEVMAEGVKRRRPRSGEVQEEHVGVSQPLV